MSSNSQSSFYSLPRQLTSQYYAITEVSEIASHGAEHQFPLNGKKFIFRYHYCKYAKN